MRLAVLACLDGDAANDNHVRIASAAVKAGLDTSVADLSSIRLRDQRVECTDRHGGRLDVSAFDWIWLLGFGARRTFLDRMQLLRSVDRGQFVNSVEAFLQWHGKPAWLLSELGPLFPETMASESVSDLLHVIRSGGTWVLKPTAGSFGCGVRRVDGSTANLESCLEQALQHGLVMLQRYVSGAKEHRWLMSDGCVMGAYQKRKGTQLKGNLSAGAMAAVAEPSAGETHMACEIAKQLPGMGIRFATVDSIGLHLLDVNFVNPGWLQTFESLTGYDLTPAALHFLSDRPAKSDSR